MTHPRTIQKIRLVLVAALLGAIVLPVAPAWAHDPARTAARTHRVFAGGGSLVRCTLVKRPMRAGDAAATAHVVRFFAPTSQAVFFAHAGDRCIWRPGTPARG